MSNRCIVCSVLVCALLVVFYVSLIFVPAQFVMLLNEQVRLGMYVFWVIVWLLVVGRDARPVRKSYQANLVAVIALLLYASMIMMTAFLFGGGRNLMTPNLAFVLRNIRVIAVPLLLGEFLRFHIIRGIGTRHRTIVIVILTAVFALANTGGLRGMLFAQNPNWTNFAFEIILPAITISAVVSFICLRGSMFSAMLVSFIFNLGGVFSPILPTFSRLVWSLVVCGLVFVVGMIHYYLTDDSSAAQRKRLARASKYVQGNALARSVSLVIAGLTIAFFLQVFPIYPVVILTGSMSGYIERGSLVLMRRIPADEVSLRVQEGTVLHYHAGRIEFVHRVIGYEYVYENGEVMRVFITQGDANPFPDPQRLAPADVIGTPLFTIPFIGYPNIIFRSLTGGVMPN